jgi:hypothetical protein
MQYQFKPAKHFNLTKEQHQELISEKSGILHGSQKVVAHRGLSRDKEFSIKSERCLPSGVRLRGKLA